MQGTLAQIIGLTIAGNAHLAGRNVTPFWADASVFQFCESVSFVAMRGYPFSWPRLRIVAETPTDWLATLAGAKGVRLHVVSRDGADMMTSGFANGGARWLMEVVRPEASEFWEANWTAAKQQAPDRRVWRVRYERREAVRVSSPRSVEAITADLSATLKTLAAFTREHRLGDNFAGIFEDARAGLISDAAPSAGPIPGGDLLSPAAARLLGASQSAWVFGGMGSWNDTGFDGPVGEENLRLGSRLYGLLQEGIAVAASSTYAGR